MMKKSTAALGLGKYGRSLAESLHPMGADVLVVDSDEEVVNDFSGKYASAVQVNMEDEEEVMAPRLKNMDIVVSCTGANIVVATMPVTIAKEQGVPFIAVKTSTDRTVSTPCKIGVNKILDPEGEGSIRSTRTLLSSSLKDFWEVDDNPYVMELKVREEWIGKTLTGPRLRKNYTMNMVVLGTEGKRWRFGSPEGPLRQDEVLLVAMEKKDLRKWQ